MGRVRGGCEVMVGPGTHTKHTQRDAGRRSVSTSRQANNNPNNNDNNNKKSCASPRTRNKPTPEASRALSAIIEAVAPFAAILRYHISISLDLSGSLT